MNTVTVSNSKTYHIHIGSNLISRIGEYLPQIIKGNKVLIISDSNVWPIYGETARCTLLNNGYCVFHYVIPAGEQSKSGDNYLKILGYAADQQLTRADCIIALGGGVVGDLAGFVSATYLRGIAYVQIPTTLLAMVDSSVGGKTAIDLPAGKNLAGSFYQPSLVLCDLNALDTLPESFFIDGCAEVIKYAILFDKTLFEHLETFTLGFDRPNVITRCIELKRDIVNLDERDLGVRQLLNLGHTIGHSIEANSGYSISHGKAVAIGTNLIAACAASTGFCTEGTYSKIHNVLKRFGLPTQAPYTAQSLTESALHDKKRNANTLSLIIPKDIGECIIHPYPIDDIETFIKAGLTYEDQSCSR